MNSTAKTPGEARHDLRHPGRLLALVFRWRYVLHFLVYAAAFAVSWSGSRGVASRHLWLSLPQAVAPALGLNLTAVILAVTILAVLCATLGAFLRTWGAASLQPGVATSLALEGGSLSVSGPYRYLRNPLYLGTIFHTLALCVLLTGTGAALALAGTVALQITLVAGEERFLREKIGAAYLAYVSVVPRFLPRLTPLAAPVTQPARWRRAFVEELNMWGTALSFAVLGWHYNALLVLQGVVVSAGVWILARGLTRAG